MCLLQERKIYGKNHIYVHKILNSLETAQEVIGHKLKLITIGKVYLKN